MQEKPSLCSQLKKEHQELQELQQQFEASLDEAAKSGKTQEAQELRSQIEEKLQNLKEKLVPKEIKATFTNPETSEQKEINFDIPEIIKQQQEFYQKFNLLTPSTKEINQIIQKHKQEIQEQIEQYGYDKMIIIPGNLPTTPELNKTLIESMPNTTQTYQSGDFKSEGGLENIKHAESRKTRILLLHSDQEVYQNENANPFLKATLDQSIVNLVLNVSKSEWNQMSYDKKNQKRQEALQKLSQGQGINFQTTTGNQQTQIQAEGLSLNEYLILQRQFFEENNSHLDEDGWTWLPKTLGASRVSRSLWRSGGRLLDAGADDPGFSGGDLCARLSRSFEN